MDLIKKINFFRSKFIKQLDHSLKNYQNLFERYSNKKKEIIEKLRSFILKGKTIRGSLVYIADELFNLKMEKKNLFYLASFFEVIHSSLLIHDDVMDNDNLRRGEKTIHFYYQEKFNNIKNNNDIGKNFAINIGDIGFFIGFDFLSKINLSEKKRSNFFSLIIEEYIKVALAQIDDVFFSQTKNEPSIKDILKIYLYKTARYTFLLPVVAVLYIKNNHLYKDKNFHSILEKLGIIFQITDDLIGFMSDQTGKDKASDIRENKKTIIQFFLWDELKNNNLKKLFGKKDITKQEIEKLRNFFNSSKSKKKIDSIINQFKMEIITGLKNNNYPQEFKNTVLDFIEYLINRKK